MLIEDPRPLKLPAPKRETFPFSGIEGSNRISDRDPSVRRLLEVLDLRTDEAAALEPEFCDCGRSIEEVRDLFQIVLCLESQGLDTADINRFDLEKPLDKSHLQILRASGPFTATIADEKTDITLHLKPLPTPDALSISPNMRLTITTDSDTNPQTIGSFKFYLQHSTGTLFVIGADIPLHDKTNTGETIVGAKDLTLMEDSIVAIARYLSYKLSMSSIKLAMPNDFYASGTPEIVWTRSIVEVLKDGLETNCKSKDILAEQTETVSIREPKARLFEEIGSINGRATFRVFTLKQNSNVEVSGVSAEIPSTRFDRWMELYDTYFSPIESVANPRTWPVLQSNNVTRAMEGSFTYTPCEPIGTENLALSPAAKETARCEALPHDHPLRAVLPDWFVPISKGELATNLRQQTDIPLTGTPGYHYQWVHEPSQNRHPHIRILLYDESGKLKDVQTFGLKGAGLRILTDKVNVVGEDAPWFQELWLPVYRRIADQDESSLMGKVVNAHLKEARYTWGGNQWVDSKGELANTLEMRASVSLLGSAHLLDVLPRPVNRYALRSIPIWNENGDPSFVDPERYAERYLAGGDDLPLGVLVTQPLGDRRLGTMVTSLLSGVHACGEDIGAGKEIIDAEVRYLYLPEIMKGYTLREPDASWLPKDKWTNAAVLNYLHGYYRNNQHRARKIYQKRVSDLYELMGIVHGRGGHFGGGLDRDGKGTISGGSIAIRNITAWGGVTDLGTAHLPWTPWSKKHQVKHINHHARFRHCDAMYLAEVQYWFYNILIGENVTDSRRTYEAEFGDLNSVLLCENQESRTGTIEAYIRWFHRTDKQAAALGIFLARGPQDFMPNYYSEIYMKGCNSTLTN